MRKSARGQAAARGQNLRLVRQSDVTYHSMVIDVHPLAAGTLVDIHGPLDPYFSLEVTTPRGIAYGNGFMLSEWHDVIVTAAHVVAEATSVLARTRSAGAARYFACTAAAFDDDENPDLALLRVPRTCDVSMSIQSMQAPPDGQGRLYGYPSLSHWERNAMIYPPVMFHTNHRWIFYRGADGKPASYGEPGASGSPFFDETRDRVIGVHHGFFNVTPTRVEHAATILDMNFLSRCREVIT